MTFSAEAERRLGYHPVASEQQKRYFEQNRHVFMGVFDYLTMNYESSRELSLALTALQEALMWANAHVACNDVGVNQ